MQEIPIKSFAVPWLSSGRMEQPHALLLLRRTRSLAGEWCQIAGAIEPGETPVVPDNVALLGKRNHSYRLIEGNPPKLTVFGTYPERIFEQEPNRWLLIHPQH